MRRIRLLLLMVLAVTVVGAVGAAAANAESLPSLLWLTTGNAESMGELGEKGSSTVVGQFNGPLVITATYLLVQLFANSTTGMADEGEAGVLFEGTKVKSNGKQCHTEGDAAIPGAVLIDKQLGTTWRVVLDLSGNAMILIHIPEFVLICPGNFPEKIKIRGDVLNKVTPFHTGEVSTLESETQCESVGSTHAKWKEYDTHEGTMASVKLEANGGLGFSEVCEEVNGKVPNKLSTPAEIMEP